MAAVYDVDTRTVVGRVLDLERSTDGRDVVGHAADCIADVLRIGSIARDWPLTLADRAGMVARGFSTTCVIDQALEKYCVAERNLCSHVLDRRDDEPGVDLLNLWSWQPMAPDRLDESVSDRDLDLLDLEYISLRSAEFRSPAALSEEQPPQYSAAACR